MSEENVEVVRRIYTERLLDRDPRRLVDDFAAPDIEYVDPPDDVDSGSRRGRTEVMLALRRARQSFTEYEHKLRKVFDGGETVIAAVSFKAKVKRRNQSEDIQTKEAHIWTFRDGKIVSFENGRNLKDALEAAGLSE